MTTRLERLGERFAADPADRAAFEALEEHHFLQGEWAALVPIYERHLAATEGTRTPLEGARLLYRMGHALDEAGVDPERAERCHRAALEIDPGFAPALRRLRARCAANGRWDEALALASREVEGITRPTERAALLAEVGEGCLRAGEAALAVDAFEQALGADAGSRRAWIGIGEALERAGRVEDAVARWEQALALALPDGRERTIAVRRLGRLLSDELGDAVRALAVFEAAHLANPAEPEWIDAMAAMLRALGRTDALLALAERRMALAGDARARAAIALETGRALLASEPSRARAWLERAAELREDGDVHLALAEAAGRSGDAAGRTWHLERAMELGAEIPSWSDLGLGGEPAEAPSESLLDTLRREAQERPADPDVLAALADALEAGHHDLERVELLERMAALATNPGERTEQLLRLGALHETRLDDAAAAAGAYEMAFLLDPSHAAAREAIERTLRKLDRRAELAALLARAAETAGQALRPALLCAAGDLHLERAAPRDAQAAFAAALAADPACAPALAGAARAAAAAGDDPALLSALLAEAGSAGLERLDALVPELLRRLDAEGRSEEALPALRRHAELSPAPRAALERLADALETLGDTEELSTVLARLDGLLAGPERGANQRRLAWLHAAEGRGEDAVAAWRAAVRHDPSDGASLESLLAAYEEAGRTEEALALLDELEAAGAATIRSRALAPCRARALERGGRPAEACAVWRALHDDGDQGDEVLAGWERCARAAGAAESLVDALAARAARAPADLRAPLEIERARVLEDELGRSDEARRAWEALADAALPAPLADEVARRLDALLERSGDFAALCDRLEARVELAPASQAWLLRTRVAELVETRLGDANRARRHLEMAVALAPDHPGPWRRLAALYDEESQPAECLHALEGELAALARADGGDELRARRLALHAHAARVAEQQLGDAERAAGHWRAVLALAPGQPEAVERLLAHGEATGDREQIAGLLRERLAQLAPTAAEAERAAGLRLRLADLLDDPDEAIAVLEEAPATAAAAERLAGLYAARSRHAELASLCEAQVRTASDPRERAGWQRRLGDAFRAGGDDAAAEAAYHALLAETPGDDDARAALCELLRARGDAAQLAAQLERALRTAGPGAPAIQRELAQLHEGPLAAPARALEHWIRLVSLDPSADEPRERAIALAAQLGRLDDAVALLRTAAGDPRTGAARARCWARCAELLAGPLARPEEAVRARRESLRLDPDQPELRHALRLALEEQGRDAEALAELHAEWRAAGARDRALLAAHGADLADARRPEALAPWLHRLVADVPDDPALHAAIAALHARAGRHADAERSLAAAVGCAPDAAWRAALHRERAALLAGPLEAPGRALAALEAAHREDPRHPGVLFELDRRYAEAGRPRERLEVLSARLVAARDRRLRAALAREAAPLASGLGEGERAADLWQAALGGLAGAERIALVAPAGDALRAAGRSEAWALLAEEELATAEPAPARALALRRGLARSWAALGRPDRALPHARALVDAGAAARDDDHRHLLALLRAEGDTVERARRLAAWAPRAPEGDERRDAWRELARLREERLALPGAAAEAWREVLRVAPDLPEAWSGLRRCAERAGDWPELARALEAEIARGVAPVAERWRRLGRLRWQRLGDPAGAEQALLAARAAEPDELTALRSLQEIADATGAFDRALALRSEEIELLGDADPERRRALWLAIGRLASRQAPDPALAARAYEAADRLGALDAAGLAGWSAALAASGDTGRWCEVFAAACDHPDARPTASDLLALAQALAARGSKADAETRLEAALARDPSLAAGWRLSAALREAAGDAAAAATAWLRAADHDAPAPAAEALTRAAAHLEATEPERALAALERAARRAPDHAPAQAALSRVAEACERREVAVAAASRLVAIDDAAATVGADERAAALRAGARAARALGHWQAAWQLGGEALALEPGAPDALAARGLAAFHLGATGECQRDLTARLALRDPDPAPTQLLVALARAFESSGALESALARHEESLALEPDHEDAHAGRLRVLERLGRRAEAAAALAAWAAHTENAGRRAERYVRAARLARLAEADASQVEGWLLEALSAEPTHATAWYELATGLWEAGRADDALAAADEGVDHVASASVRAVLQTIRGRVLEARGEEERARAAYAEAVRSDPEAREAALAGARLLRRAGAWQEAAEVLRRAAEGRGDAAERAELCFELGRLLAGPLEDVSGALEAWDRAHALAPDRLDVREARAALLSHVPERASEALAELLTVLEAAPLRADAIRRAARLLRARGDEPGLARGLALLRALGATAPGERAEAPPRIDLACAAAMPPLDAHAEALREAVATLAPLAREQHTSPADADAASDTGADAEGAVANPATASSPPVESAWQAGARAVVGAPDLLALDPGRLRGALEALVAEAREGRLGRGAGKVARRLDPRAVDRVDLVAWRSAIRARVWARVADALGGDLRTVLAAIAAEAGAGDRAEDADLSPWLAAAPEATALLQAIVRAWLGAGAPGRRA